MSDRYQSLSHSKWDCKYHVVFVSKGRRKALFGETRRGLGPMFHALARQKECQSIEGHLMPDHVHMCIAIPPKHPVASVIGFSFTRHAEPKRRIAPKAMKRFKERVREITSRTRGVSFEDVVKELTTYLRGWRSYFGFCQTPSVLKGLEEWVRRRLRSYRWKQWRTGHQRFVELRQRGVGLDLAAQTAASCHGPWRLSASPALSVAFPNTYFDSLGLPRLAVG